MDGTKVGVFHLIYICVCVFLLHLAFKTCEARFCFSFLNVVLRNKKVLLEAMQSRNKKKKNNKKKRNESLFN